MLPEQIRTKFDRKQHVAVVRLAGVIASGGVAGPQPSLNLGAVGPLLERAFKLDRLAAVVLVINSPGGSPTQSALIADRIRQLSAEHEGVPVLAVLEDVAASGGYWLACAADEIIAHETSMVGSIGVISGGFGFAGLIEKLGIERRVSTAGENKARLDPFAPVSPEDQAWLDGHLSALHEMFVEWVTSRRGDRLGDNDSLFTGDVWTGGEAKGLGLVDSLAPLHRVLADRFGDATPVEINAPVPLIARLVFGAASATGLGSSRLQSTLGEVEALGWSRLRG